jgi:hypothetical protein
MLQTAIFVDAGYLYAQGSTLLAGRKCSRADMTLDVDIALGSLRAPAGIVSPDARLLRIYWYDGLMRGGRLSTDQSSIANAQDVKLRLGMINGYGQQKGVDSLIVTDMIDLARNRALSDALILAGDEDIRVGVQVAQTFGVRIHLLGIDPAHGSQSPNLLQEADTTHVWTKVEVARMIKLDAPAFAAAPAEAPATLAAGAVPAAPDEVTALSIAEISETMAALSPGEAAQAAEYLDKNVDAIPRELDAPTLGRLKKRLGRDLTSRERADHRLRFAEALRKAAADFRSPQ